VILLKYARTFSAVIALLDLPKLMQRYVFVLEPCWAGYCDPSILMYVAPGNPVMVMCFTKEDHAFVERVGSPLVPLRMGPADWVNADVFRAPAPQPKIYDLVMVANWARHKRHSQLFAALATIRDRDVRVLLVGFAWSDRTADDIRREAAAMNNPRVTVDIRENVKHETLSGLLAQSKAFVFLSRKEGDNKAVVEAMFADVPAIVFADTIGGAGSRVNAATGVFASDAELARKIVYMLDHYREFTPRAWALEHTGSAVATRVLDDALRTAVTKSGGRYTRGIVEKTNAPNLAYKDPAHRAGFAADYDFILGCRRDA
jgi:glycosyltransferase involved in cell wall biosynthesis